MQKVRIWEVEKEGKRCRKKEYGILKRRGEVKKINNWSQYMEKKAKVRGE